MKNSLADAARPLVQAYPNIVKEFEAAQPGYSLHITCVYRSPDEQFDLFKKGRAQHIPNGTWVTDEPSQIVTNIDGHTKLGAHNYHPARAIDVAVVGKDTGRTYWDEKLYQPLVAIAAKYGLESGGSWNSFKDWPHIQIPNFRDYKEV